MVRFEQTFRFLHVANSNLQVDHDKPGYDRLFKVRKLLDLVLPHFESEYVLYRQITVDEAMIPFKGRLRFKQYMKAKPVKWGIKFYTPSDSINHLFISNKTIHLMDKFIAYKFILERMLKQNIQLDYVLVSSFRSYSWAEDDGL